MNAHRKGMTFETIGFVILGIIGLAIMLSYTGVIRDSVNSIFCSTYSKVADPPAFCEKNTCVSERVEIMTDDKEEFMREIAAYAITCYHKKAGCLDEENVRICYALIAKNHPQTEIFEGDMTKLLEDEKGCEVIENSMIMDETGAFVKYDGNCGIKDMIEWNVSSISISDQPIILIEYDEIRNTVKVKA